MIPPMRILKRPKVMDVARGLWEKGNTLITANHLFCLNVHDDYIHQVFPLLKNESVKKPNYFGQQSIGAHITIIYPEESKTIDRNDLEQEHDFFVKDLV